MGDSLDRFRAYIECQFQNTPVFSQPSAPFVTISRQAGAGGLTVARLLADRLRERDAKNGISSSWTVFDKTLVDEVLRDHGLSSQLAECMNEDGTSEILDILEEFFGLHPPKWSLVKKTSGTILHLACMGRVILVGRGANIITRRLEGGLHVRIVGSLKKRVQHLKDYFGFGTAEAVDFLRQEDSGRERYLRKYFYQDINDPELYDLVVNTDETPYDRAAALIAYAVKQSSAMPASVPVI